MSQKNTHHKRISALNYTEIGRAFSDELKKLVECHHCRNTGLSKYIEKNISLKIFENLYILKKISV